VSEAIVNTITNVVEVISDERQVVVVESEGPQGPPGEQGAQGPAGPGGARGYFGSFYDMTDQPGSATPQPIALGVTAEAEGISIENGDEIVFSAAGVYSLTFSIQFSNLNNVPHTADVWVEYQGEAYPDSATRFDIPARKSANIPGHLVGTVNYVASADEGGRVRIMWLNGNELVKLEAYPASGEVPAVPSVILTVVQVMYTQLGPQGEQGPQGDPGVGIPEGGTTGQVLAKVSDDDYDTDWVDPSGGGGGSTPDPDIQEFTTPGTSTWTKPAGAKMVHILCFGGGGGGGSGRRRGAENIATQGAAAGSGGGAGGRHEVWVPAQSLAEVCDVVVGAGGSGGAEQTVDGAVGLLGGQGGVSSATSDSVVISAARGGYPNAAAANQQTGGTLSPSGGSFTERATSVDAYTSDGALGTAGTGSGGNGGRGGLLAGGGGAGGGKGVNSTSSTHGGVGGTGGSFLIATNPLASNANTRTGGGNNGGLNTGTAGGDGANATHWSVGGTGGGGGGSSSTVAGNGGNGGFPGGGGGGGGAASGSFDSGAGGNGGNGYVRITTYF
jgi:hypothetical protein